MCVIHGCLIQIITLYNERRKIVVQTMNFCEIFLSGFISLFNEISIFSNLSARAGYNTRSICKRNLTGLHSEFSFSKTNCLTKAEETSLPYYLPIAGRRIIGFIPFPRVLVICEMSSISSRI